jgi:hypothetical protein
MTLDGARPGARASTGTMLDGARPGARASTGTMLDGARPGARASTLDDARRRASRRPRLDGYDA